MKFLSKEYIESLPAEPKHMTELGKFVYYRTYSRFLPRIGRRETWKETVARAVEYNIGLAYRHMKKLGVNVPLEELQKEAKELFDSMYNLKQFLSGRTLWVGGADTKVADKFPLANFNCSFTNIQKWDDLAELFYLLLVGTGVGFKCTKDMANNLPPIRNNVEISHSEYKPLPANERLEDTILQDFGNGYAKIYVGDSKEGWVEALRLYLHILTKKEYEHVKSVKFSYNSVRPKGEALKTFGGYASGYEPLREMFDGFDQILKGKLDPDLKPWEVVDKEKGYVKLRPIAILDMGNLVGNNVVVGGVRRTAEIFLFDADDYETMFAKYGINGIWGEESFERHERIKNMLIERGIEVPSWFDKLSVKHYDVEYELKIGNGEVMKTRATFTDKVEAENFAKSMGVKDYFPFPYNPGRPYHHRRMSNNSVAFTKKPEKKSLQLIVEMLRSEGEPGFINLETAAKRRLKALGIENPNRELLEQTMVMTGLNPCAEILLDNKGVCNLTTINFVQFVEYDTLNLDELIRAQKRSVRAGLRMTLAELELESWKRTQDRDRLLGCSITGEKDAMAMCSTGKMVKVQLNGKLDYMTEESILSILRDEARKEADKYAKKLRVASPLLVTTVKPEGTLSQVAGGVSSGLHWSHSPYYIRRVRISAVDPLAKAVLEMGWKVNPEVGTPGETYEERMKNAKTYVIDFPVASGADRTKDDVSAQEQLDTYFMFQKHYTEHNASNTIHVRPDEWEGVVDRIYENWDDFTAVSFLSYDGGTYQLAPYEAISKEEYEKLSSSMKPFDPIVLQKFETGDDFDIGDEGCEGGICPVR